MIISEHTNVKEQLFEKNDSENYKWTFFLLFSKLFCLPKKKTASMSHNILNNHEIIELM